MKSSPSIWHYVVSVKWMVKISSIFVVFLENTNFTVVCKRNEEKNILMKRLILVCNKKMNVC